MTDTERMEKVAFAVAERVARRTVDHALSAHVATCGASEAMLQLESRINTRLDTLATALEQLTASLVQMDKKLAGGDYEFRDVDRRILEVKAEASDLKKRMDAWDAYIRAAALKILLGSTGLAALVAVLVKWAGS